MSDRTQAPSTSAVKIFISPDFRSEDSGDGGVRRVVEAQRRYLPPLGFDIVTDPHDADLIACHSGDWVPRKVNQRAVRVVHCHGLYWDEPQYQWWAWAKDRNHKIIDTFRKADVVVSPSEWVANILRRDLWLDTEVLYNGIELPVTHAAKGAKKARSEIVMAKPSDHERYVLWNKARVDPVCEVDSLGALIRRMGDVEFVSTFAPKEWMDRAAAQGGAGPWRVGDNLTLTGRLPYGDALGWVKKAGVYLCTTREVFSVGLLEAMSFGVPVVGYAWGGQREVVRHKVDGWLAQPGDVNGLAAGVEYVLDPANWDRLSKNARSRAGEFTWRVQMQRCADIYHRALAQFTPTDNPPKVSVVIPCHNLENYIEQAMETAALQQVRGGHEVIVVDDASTDGSHAVIVAKQHELENRRQRGEPISERIDCVSLPHNQYLAGALNEGIARARGKYILNLDADNTLPKRALLELSTVLDDDESVDVVYGPVALIKEDGSPVGVDRVWPPAEFSYQEQMNHRNQVQSSAIFRRKVWERAKGYRQHVLPRVDGRGRITGDGLVRLNSDADFWCRAATLGFKFRNIGGSPTLIYRQRGDSMSHTVQDYDWTAWCPKEGLGARVPMGVSGLVSTLEPIAVTVIVSVPPEVGAGDGGVWRSVESLWPQTISEWECIVVGGEDLTGIAPYYLSAETIEAAVARARGTHIVFLQAGEYLHPDALSRLIGAVQWSYETHREDMRSRFAYADWVYLEDGQLHRADDQVPGVALFPKSFVSAALATGMTHTWAGRAAQSGLCGQYVEAPLLVRPWRPGVSGAGEDKELGACGCGGARKGAPKGVRGCVGPGCGSGGVSAPRAQRQAATDARLVGAPPAGVQETMVLLRYTGKGGGRSINGISKGPDGKARRYHFGSDRSHREKYVYKSDVPSLLGTGMFEVVQVGSPVTPVPSEMAEVGVGG